MQTKSIIVAILALSLSCHAPALAQPAADDGLGELLRSMITDSLVGGGRRSGQRYVAADAASDSLLRSAGLVLAPRSDAEQLLCPSSTDAAGQPVAGEVGYLVRIDRMRQAPAVLRLNVRVSCTFVYRGDRHGFAQGSSWELRQAGGRWRVSRTLDRWVT